MGPIYRAARRYWQAMAAEGALGRTAGVPEFYAALLGAFPISGPSAFYQEARRQLTLALGTSGGALRAKTTGIWLGLTTRMYRTSHT